MRWVVTILLAGLVFFAVSVFTKSEDQDQEGPITELQAGNDWARENDLDDPEDCVGRHSAVFTQGCEKYARENGAASSQ